MNTNPDAFQQQSINPANIQCPRCSTYHPKLEVSYLNPRTRESQSAEGLPGCLIMIVGYFVSGIVIELVIGGLLFLSGHLNDPLSADVGLIGIPIAFAGAITEYFVYRDWRRNRLRKTHITEWYCICGHCDMKWIVRQEPTGKKLS